MGVRGVARRLKVSHSSISRQQTLGFRDCKTPVREDRYIILTSQRNRFLFASNLAMMSCIMQKAYMYSSKPSGIASTPLVREVVNPTLGFLWAFYVEI